jgi:hypothetical protein
MTESLLQSIVSLLADANFRLHLSKLIEILEAEEEISIRRLEFAKDKVDVSGSRVRTQDGSGNALTSTILGLKRALDVNIMSAGVQRTPTFSRVSGTTATVPAGTYAVALASVGSANVLIGAEDMPLKPGETINVDAGALNNTLAEIAYNTETPGAELIITTLT